MAIKTCPTCGGANHENAPACLHCNADLSGVPPSGVPAAPPSPPPPMFPQSPQIVAETQTNGMAIAALVLGLASLLFSFLSGIVGLILGIIAAVQINSSGGRQKGMGMAIAGICMSLVLPLVLPALLFPVFSKARDKARENSARSQCMNNQRQIAIAISMYAQEHDEVLPDASTVWSTIKLTSSQRLNTALLQASPSELRCPESKRTNGYGYNKQVSKLALGDKRMTDPTMTLLTADGGDSQNLLTQFGDIDVNRHKKMFVSSYIDGHVERVWAAQVSPQVLNIR